LLTRSLLPITVSVSVPLVGALFVRIGAAVTSKPSEQLDPYLKQMALSTLMFVILFGAGNLL